MDPNKDERFVLSDQWAPDLDLKAFRHRDLTDPSKGSVARSFSGGERNRMFIQGSDNFEDVTLVSGADSRADSRGFVITDFDRDGWLDLGITSPQSPRFQLLKNKIGERKSESNNQAVFVKLEGGNQAAKASTEWSSRDAYGSTILATIGETKRIYQLSCGEGLASQNGKWIHIGMGESQSIDRLDVTWPSGKKTSHENVKSGSRIKLFEDGRTAKIN
jgi:hypothetical protein